jgi:DNA mismatch repair protein MutL
MVEVGPGGSCEVTALDAQLAEIPEERVAEVVSGRRAGPESFRRELCAAAACAAAVRDGQELDQAAALELASQALGLPEARCPHGRPVWHSVSRRDLFRLVQREL